MLLLMYETILSIVIFVRGIKYGVKSKLLYKLTVRNIVNIASKRSLRLTNSSYSTAVLISELTWSIKLLLIFRDHKLQQLLAY